MITDDELYRLAIFLGSAAMLLVVLYHFLEVNARNKETAEQGEKKSAQPTPATSSVTGSKKDPVTVVGSQAAAGNTGVSDKRDGPAGPGCLVDWIMYDM
ncbi:hypothetical protein THITE_2123767 [Paecilomyces variotii No. 5]|uniref:Dolichyl-diphosphooligosaccharide--protein glycosyltransferase subunit 4 n=1 Tax=Byssochlamys spectabilis (strain No. 5 / NBRC 109023) TaxID=1356009 RepID=V5G6U0_BYSSN|nr:hypothetical protein THITE_2123767 [Paecilomyces variotii No. 5]